jgi:hypothetical protein
LNFTGSTLFDSGFIPPDTMGAVGLNHIVELINGRYSVYRKHDGVRVQTNTLDQFWTDAGVSFQGFTFDPRILYDPVSHRWFAASADNRFGANHFLLAVSKSADPTAGWLGLAIGSASTDPLFVDFPTLGFDRDGVYLAARPTIVAVSKADLLAATSPIAVAKALGNTPTDSLVFGEADIPLDHAVPATRLLSGAPMGASATAVTPSATASSVVHVTVFENIPVGETGGARAAGRQSRQPGASSGTVGPVQR